jgi:hypothetical protein
MSESLTKIQFIRMLCGASDADDSDALLRNAFDQGWIEAQDLTSPDEEMKRIDAARILHLYMLHVLHIPDLTDISGAEVLKDLYDCRVCVNHIAQVFLRGVMDAVRIPAGGKEILIFDSQSLLKAEDFTRL